MSLYPLNKSYTSVYLPPFRRYLDVMQRTEDEFVALKDHIKATKEAKKKVKNDQTLMYYCGSTFIRVNIAKALNFLFYFSGRNVEACNG